MNTSHSMLGMVSRYVGIPMSVLRLIAATDSCQPRPKGPLPDPESYDSESCGPNPPRPGDVATGTDIVAVPVTGLVENFSPMPRIAPPPFGSDTVGAETKNAWVCDACDWSVRAAPSAAS